MTHEDTPLGYSQLDRNLLVWGQVEDGHVRAVGRGSQGYESTRQGARDSGIESAYYHPQGGWTYAATGWPVGEAQRDESEAER